MKDNEGFTLVELLAVIVLIAVLSIVAVSTYRGINESAKRKALNAKIIQLKAAAEKWGRENNITSKTTISVNNLVVEGYITADEVQPSGLSYIKNPVTSENMICNTIDLTFSNGVINSSYHNDVQDCNLAKQSLVDTNIDIRVVDSDNKTLSGSGSIAKWTNKDVVIIVNSTQYDTKATSISFDFEGNTKTKDFNGLEKYTGASFITEDQAKKYYNVFYIKSELILNSIVVVTYDIPGEGTKSRAYTIRFDQEEATATLKTNSEWITEETPVTILVDDGKGSGPSKFYLTTTESFNDPNRTETPADYKGTTLESLKVGKYYVWTEDQAGNRSKKHKLVLEINNVDDFIPDCEVVFDGNKGQGHWYKEVPVTPGGKNVTPAGISGVNVGVSGNPDDKVYTGYAAYNTVNTGYGETRTTNTTRAGVPYYCHAKSLAGNYGTNSATLWLDMTPPTVTLDITSDSVYSQYKTVTATVTDNLSGIDRVTNIKYAWALAGEQPSDWGGSSSFIVNPGESFETTNPMIGNGYTGIYYLWVDVSNVHDYAGNYATGVNGQGTIGVFGPYMFDNTPPVCDFNNGKTNWTKGSYTISQHCRDDDETPDQAGCVEEYYFKTYTQADTVKSDNQITIEDGAGNTTVCDYDVYLDNTSPMCDGVGGKTDWTKGTYTVYQNCSEDNVNQSGCAQTTFSRSYTNTDSYSTDSIVISDKVGNTKTCPTNVYLDNTPPVCGGTEGEGTSWTNGSRTITVDCQDAHSGCKQSRFSKTHSSSKKFDTIDIEDNVGNTTTCGGTGYRFFVDTNPPECIPFYMAHHECTPDGFNLEVHCHDPEVDGSGMRQCINVSQGNGSTVGPDGSGIFWLEDRVTNVKESKTYTISDQAGNTSTCDIFASQYTQYRKRTCNYGARCYAAGCQTIGTCKSSCCGQATINANGCYDSEQPDLTCTWEDDNGATCAHQYVCVGNRYDDATCTSIYCCGCDLYYRDISKCGCASWSGWSDWTYSVQSCDGATDGSCEIETRTVYSYNTDCPNQ